MMRNRVVLIFFLLILCLNQLHSQSLGFRTRISGYYLGGQFSYDIYKPYSQLFVNFDRFSSPLSINKGRESDIYATLFRRVLSPKYVLIQGTLYQMTAVSSYLETDHPKIYARFNFLDQFNLLRSVGSEYEEPYAFTIFLGNILFLSYTEKEPGFGFNQKRKQSGSALAGFGYSFGKHQVLDNIYIHDFWQQIEWMLVGNLHEPQQRKLFWNFRCGLKFHKNNLVRDVFIFSFERNHTSWAKNLFSFAKNSIIKYQAYIPLSFADQPPLFVYQLLTFSKKFPITFFNHNMHLSFGGGFKWQWIHLYDRDLNTFENEPSGIITWLIQPNIEF